MIVDRAVYRDGRRTAEPDDFAELHAACQSEGRRCLAGPLRAEQRGVRRGRARVRPPRARGRGRRQGASAPEARALRRHPVPRPATGPLRRRDGDGRVRGGRDLRRPAVRDHRAPRRRAGAGAGAAAARGAPGSAPARPAGDRVRDRRPRRRRLRAGRRRPARTTSTRSRTRSSAASPTVSRRIYELTREVIEFQRATGPLEGHPRAADGRARDRRRAAPVPARRPRPRHSRRGACRRVSCAPPEHPQRQPDARDEGARARPHTRRTSR